MGQSTSTWVGMSSSLIFTTNLSVVVLEDLRPWEARTAFILVYLRQVAVSPRAPEAYTQLCVQELKRVVKRRTGYEAQAHRERGSRYVDKDVLFGLCARRKRSLTEDAVYQNVSGPHHMRLRGYGALFTQSVKHHEHYRLVPRGILLKSVAGHWTGRDSDDKTTR